MTIAARSKYRGDGEIGPYNANFSDEPEQYELVDHLGKMPQAFLRRARKVSLHSNSRCFNHFSPAH